MKKVLIVAYAFPPVGGGGVQRPTKFVKYLREFGWEPVVLTVANPSVPLLDESLIKDIPDGVKVYRARSLEPSYNAKKQNSLAKKSGFTNWIGVLKRAIANVLLPDVQVLWWPGLVLQLLSILRIERPDCLYVTAPPFSSFIPVVVIGKLFKIPVVLDFRDEWSFSRQQWENAIKTPLAFSMDSIFEHFVLKNCACLVAVNASYIKSLRLLYPDIDGLKNAVITNGFDDEDFEGIATEKRTDTHVKMVYAGTVWNGNSLEPLVEALKLLLDRQPELVNKMRISVYGRVVESQEHYLNTSCLSGIVKLFGYQQHSVVLREMFNADVLLLSISDVAGAEKIILGKTFEYVATGNHILAIVPDGETKDILEQNYANLSVAHPKDVGAIYEHLVNIADMNFGSRKLVRSNLECFSREKLTGRLAEILEHVCE